MVSDFHLQGLWTDLSNLSHPHLSCTPPTFSSYMFLLLPLFFQSALLHPCFKSKPGPRFTRLGMMPLNVYWSLRFPFRNCQTPLSEKASVNMFLAAAGIYFAIKALEWGFVSGPYHFRSLKTIDGVQKWVRNPTGDPEHSSSSSSSLSVNQTGDGTPGFLSWSLLHFFSWVSMSLWTSAIAHPKLGVRPRMWWWGFDFTPRLRGHQFDWGPEALANDLKPKDLILRIIKFHFIMTPALAFLILSRDSIDGSPKELLRSFGLPDFLGSHLLAFSFLNLSFGLLGYGCLESLGSTITLLAHLIYTICHRMSLRGSVVEFFNPALYPPLTQPVFQSTSLSYFWGKAWHQNLRRCFLICGGKPAFWLASRLGWKSRGQRFFGVLGTFAASAFLHEYRTYVILFSWVFGWHVFRSLEHHLHQVQGGFHQSLVCTWLADKTFAFSLDTLPSTMMCFPNITSSDHGHQATTSARTLCSLSIRSRICHLFSLTTPWNLSWNFPGWNLFENMGCGANLDHLLPTPYCRTIQKSL